MTDMNRTNEIEELTAYAEGELTGPAAEAFKANVAANPQLQAQLQRYLETRELAQAWAMEPAPGAERTARLMVPSLGKPRSAWFAASRIAVQVAAAAALFAAGMYVGQLRSTEQPAPVTRTTPPPPASHLSPAPAAATPPAADESQKDVASTRRYTREEDGRIHIETTDMHSGARATWVVDGSFQLAQTRKVQ